MPGRIGIVLFMHQKLAEGFIETLKAQVGDWNSLQVRAIPYTWHDNAGKIEQKLIRTLRERDEGNGVAVLTDFPGDYFHKGNRGAVVGASLISVKNSLEDEGRKIEILFEANYAALWNLVWSDLSLEDAVSKALEHGKKSMTSTTAGEPHWAGGRAAPVNEGPWPGQV